MSTVEIPWEQSPNGSYQTLNLLTESALLLNLINPGQLTDTITAPKTDDLPRETILWRSFVTCFTILGDFRKGGYSVVAGSGVQISGRAVLLLASNHKIPTKVLTHLYFVLNTLQSFGRLKTKDHREVFKKLLSSSIELSWEKVQNYSKRLTKLVDKVVSYPEGLLLENFKNLHNRLAEIKSRTHSHRKVCRWAYKFSKSQEFKYLHEKCSKNPNLLVYHLIRHYIGRLGSWHRAVYTLIDSAMKIPHLLQGLVIEIVPQPLTAWRSSEEVTGLRTLIKALQLDLSFDQVLTRLQDLYNMATRNSINRSESIETAFLRAVTNQKFKPLVHAESLLADYIYATKLDFINDEKYIGCSKRSCTLCLFYLERHPTQVEPLPCHGNLWTKWSPPLLLSTEGDQHTDNLAHHIIMHLRRLIKDRLMCGKVNTRRLPESETGITRTSDGWALL